MIFSDDGFKVPSTRATEALEAASKMLDWCKMDANKNRLSQFSKWLVVALKACFNSTSQRWRLRVEKMWQQFHELHVSDTFTGEWDKFFQESLSKQGMPTLFQYVTRKIFHELLENQYAVCDNSDEVQPCPLTWEEENALRYVGGYVCRKVKCDIKKSSLARAKKEEMSDLVMDLCGDEMDEDEGTETWTNAIDRGGLWHISDETHALFLIIEDEIRFHLKVTSLTKLDESTRKTILDSTLKNEDLLFQWTLISTNAEDSIGSDLLRRICTLYLTVRGFAFASSCLELYKQRHKKQVQKSKALRRDVQESTSQ